MSSSSETTYCIERAKSGRAKCKKCKEGIEKGALRIGVSSPGPGDFMMTSWYHPPCVVIGRKLKQQGIKSVEDFFRSGLVEDQTDDNIMADGEEMAKLCGSAMSVKADKSPNKNDTPMKEGSPDDASSTMAKIKALALSLLEEEEEEGPKKKKVKVENQKKKISAEEKKATEIYLDFYYKKSNDYLKDILRWNQQPVSGPKDILLSRILDGHSNNGRLSICPTCGQGRLKLDDKNTKQAYCNGYFDEDLQVRKSCFYTCPIKDAPRLTPWHSEEPSEDEKKKMEEEVENIRKGGVVSSAKGNKELSKLSEKALKIDWDLSQAAGIKKAASDLLKIVSGVLELPEIEKKARMAVGKVIVANKDKSAVQMIELLVDQFGLASVKKEQSESKTKALTSVCGHEANVQVMQAILELGECYFKEGNSNAGATYKKVANAIKDLNFEITGDNALGLGKGKTKIAGIGKGSAEKIHEFVTTGKMEKLEEKRAAGL